MIHHKKLWLSSPVKRPSSTARSRTSATTRFSLNMSILSSTQTIVKYYSPVKLESQAISVTLYCTTKVVILVAGLVDYHLMLACHFRTRDMGLENKKSQIFRFRNLHLRNQFQSEATNGATSKCNRLRVIRTRYEQT